MLTLNELRYGCSEPLSRQIPLKAGLLSLFYEGGDLRYIKYGEFEIIRRIYMAVRDRNWGIVPPVFSNVVMDIGADRFNITYEVDNRQSDIQFQWQGLIRGEADGTLTFSMVGQAITSFMKNRVGLCVLHPAGLAGKPCVITHIDGSRQKATFPSQITPEQPPLPFTDIAGLNYTIGSAQVAITFEGEVFEMEDQRNWTDASFKTFSTPLRYPYPVEILAGTNVSQTITIRPRRTVKAAPASKGIVPGLVLEIGSKIMGRLPALGTGIASHGSDLSTHEISRLKALKLSHLRADVWLDDRCYPDIFAGAVSQSAALSVPLALALHLTDNGEAELRSFKSLVRTLKPRLALLLVYPAKENYAGGSPTYQVVAWVKKSGIAGLIHPPCLFASGTDTDFIFFQRNLPPFDQLDAVCFAINPQVHAFDNASLMETLEAQSMAVATARQLCGGKPVLVCPVTLRPRHNPYATGAIPPTPPGELPPQVDYRQPSLFTAAWLVGSLRAMTLGCASAVTFFETTSWRGLMETETGSPVSGKFRSIPGAVFPLYHILADVAEYAPSDDTPGAEVLATTSSDALKIQGLALVRGDRRCLLVANLSVEVQVVTVKGLPARIRIRSLDETNVQEAMVNPDAYRSQMTMQNTMGGQLKLKLLPYAVVKIDWKI